MTVDLPLLLVVPSLCHLLNPLSSCRVWPVTVMDGAMKLALSSSLFTYSQLVSCADGNFSPFISSCTTVR